MDGLELLRELRSTDPQVKVIVVSGFMIGSMHKVAEMAGADATIEKPSAYARLLPTVCSVLNRRAGASS
jgi:DNA-binding response OmpR family regulator